MELKFSLNKLLKVDNIEGYTLGSLDKLRNYYFNDFLEKTEGYDPDFPTSNVGNKGREEKGRKTYKMGGRNVYAGYDEKNPDPNFRGISDRSAITKSMFEDGTNTTARTR